jgi:hypothetical protein
MDDQRDEIKGRCERDSVKRNAEPAPLAPGLECECQRNIELTWLAIDLLAHHLDKADRVGPTVVSSPRFSASDGQLGRA